MPNPNQRPVDTASGAAFLPASAPFRPRFLARAALLAVGGMAAALVLGAGKMQCGIVRMFHVPCPSCGTTRAAWALLHGDVLLAFRLNPLAPIVIASLVALGARAVYVTARDGGLRRVGDRPWGIGVLVVLASSLVLEIVVWALRFAGWFGGPVPV